MDDQNNKKQEKEIKFEEVLAESAPTILSKDDLSLQEAAAQQAKQLQEQMDDSFGSLSDLSEKEAKHVKKFLKGLRAVGGSTVNLICAGDACDYRAACPLWQTKVGKEQVPDPYDPTKTHTIEKTRAPVGKPCPLEAVVRADEYTYFASHQDVDLTNPVHRRYVNELCHLAALEWRMSMLLAYDHHGMVSEIPAAISPDGQVHSKFEMNQLIEVMTKINDRRSKIMKELTISPEAEYKRKVAEGDTKEKSQAKLAAEKRQKLLETKKEKQQKRIVEIPDHVRNDPDFTGKIDEQTEEK